MRINCVLILALLVLSISCSLPNQSQQKINGVSFVASRDSVNNSHVAPLVNLNANFAAVMPFGFVRDIDEPNLQYNSNKQWFGETFKGVSQYVKELHAKDIKVMLKPQIWVFHGVYTGHIKMKNELHWNLLERTYSNFILDLAKLAQTEKIDLFCIGTELDQFVINRPEYWFDLIKNIKTIYKGKLTYAANWDEYNRVPFWKELDYIGIDAYFPLTDMQTPTIEACEQSWQPYKAELFALYEKQNKPILFTEFGYRSIDFTTKEPWKSDRQNGKTNLMAQKNAIQALFNTFWGEPWFAGGFVWKWFVNHEQSGGPDNNRFTPQNKPAEQVIKSAFKMY